MTAGLILTLFGLWIALPWETFSSSISYDLMAQFATETGWGFVTTLVGVTLVVASVRKDQWMTVYTCFLASAMFFIIFSSLTVANPASTGTPTYFIMFVRCLWLAAGMSLGDRQKNHE